MKAISNWLDEIVIVNESADERLPGSVSLYRSGGDACSALEHWWVNDREGHAFTASGVRLVLEAEPNGQVIIARREECTDGSVIVALWLQSLARATLEARKRTAQNGQAILSKAEEQDALPITVEGLIGYIGLPRASRSHQLTPWVLLLGTIAVLLTAVLIYW